MTDPVGPHHVRMILTNSDGVVLSADVARELLEPLDLQHVTNGDPDARNCPACLHQAEVRQVLQRIAEELARAYRDRDR